MGVNSTKFSCLLVPVHFQYVRKFFQDGTRPRISSNVGIGNCSVKIAGLTVPL